MPYYRQKINAKYHMNKLVIKTIFECPGCLKYYISEKNILKHMYGNYCHEATLSAIRNRCKLVGRVDRITHNIATYLLPNEIVPQRIIYKLRPIVDDLVAQFVMDDAFISELLLEWITDVIKEMFDDRMKWNTAITQYIEKFKAKLQSKRFN